MKLRLKIQLIGLITLMASSTFAQDTEDKTLNNDRQAQAPGLPETEFTPFEIADIPAITEKNKRSPKFIRKRLELLVGTSMKMRCEAIGISYPPKFVLHRAFKYEGEYEIWVGNSRTSELKLLAILPICAMDNYPGTKLQQGDGKTPEGFYQSSIMYGSSMDFMWINLNVDNIDDYGNLGGQYSSFKVCLNYPLAIDRRRTARLLSKSADPGNAICVHGNCVSAGCIAFKNKDFLPVFLSQQQHDMGKYGKVMLHIFPYRFDRNDKEMMIKEAYTEMNSAELRTFWAEIEKGYTLFEQKHKALKVAYKGEKYFFSNY